MKKLLLILLCLPLLFTTCKKEVKKPNNINSNTDNNNISSMFADIKGDWAGYITYNWNDSVSVGDWYANISSDGPNLIIDGYFVFDLTEVPVSFSGDIDDGGGYPSINATTQSGGDFSGVIDIEESSGSGTWTHPPTMEGIWIGSKSK